MKRILLVLFFLSFKLTAQDVYPLHPSIGDTLDLLEKLDYSLFPEVENNGFQYALITYRTDAFFLTSHFDNDSVASTKLDQETIIEAQQNIEKVNAYYRYLKEKETTEKNSTIHTDKAPPIRLEGPMSDKMRKEARMNVRLQEDARRMQEFQQGLRPRELHIEFK